MIMATTVKLTVNGTPHVLEVTDPDMPLLYALRNQLGLHGPHYGCGLSQCGACTVHYFGEALRSCVMPISAVDGAEIVTLEGLGTAEKPHPVQQAFIDEQAAQCGYCINGMIMQAAAFLTTTKRPSEEMVRQALAANLCKCGTHVRILRAVMRAAEQMG
jgi:nicotinate dehydrogenase subunit A